MPMLSASLALIGVAALILAALIARGHDEPAPEPQPVEPEPDPAAPYREGLRAVIRLQQAAQECEQLLHVETMRSSQEEMRLDRSIRDER
jgi:hypothetical protein